jgi:hypothetical protein
MQERVLYQSQIIKKVQKENQVLKRRESIWDSQNS